MKKLITAKIILVALVSQTAHAQTYIDAQYASLFSSNFVQTNARSALESALTQLNYSVPALQVGNSPVVNINDIGISMKLDSYQITNTTHGIALQTLGHTATVSIGSISVQQQIQEVVSGITVNISLSAVCTGITAQFNDPQSMIRAELVPVQNGNMISVGLNNPVINLGAPTWQMQSLNCQGAQGFEQLVNTTIQNDLQAATQSTSPLGLLLQQKVAASLQAAASIVQYNWTTPQKIFSSPYVNGTGGITAWIYPSTLQPTAGGGWQSFGTARFTLPFTLAQQPAPFSLPTHDYSSLAGQNLVAISDTAILSLIQNYFAPQQWSYKSLANQFAGFNRLLQSRFLQFFLWEDLWNWPKTTQFPIVASMSSPMQLQWSGNQNLQISSALQINMSAANKPFVNFKGSLATNMGISVHNNQVVFQPKNSKSKLSYAYDPSYCKHCSGMAISVIQDALQTYMNSTPFQFPLPEMQMLSLAPIQATGMQRNSALHSFVINFAPVMLAGAPAGVPAGVPAGTTVAVPATSAAEEDNQ